MNRKVLKKAAIVAAALSLCTSYIVKAEHIDNTVYNYETGRVDVSGKFFDKNNGEYATILVVKKDTDLNDFTSDKVVKQKQIMIKDGAFSYSFELNNPRDRDIYTAYVYAGTMKNSNDFTYVDDIASIVSGIFTTAGGAATKDDIARSLEDNKGVFGLEYTVYNNIEDKSFVAQALMDNKDIIGDDPEKLKAIVNSASIIQSLNERKTTGIVEGTRFIDEKALGLDKLDEALNVTAYRLYNESITEAGKNKVIAALQGNKYEYADITEVSDAAAGDAQNLRDKYFLADFVYQATMAAITDNNTEAATSHISAALNDNNSVNKFDLQNYNSLTSAQRKLVDIDLMAASSTDRKTIQNILNQKKDTNTSKSDIPDDNKTGGTTSNKGTIGTGKGSGNYSQSYGVIKEEPKSFTDIENVGWAKDAIMVLAEKNIINGKENGIFAPNDFVTRAEFLKMLLLTMELKTGDYSCDFTDVGDNDWFYPYIAAAYKLGIVRGYENGEFGANDNITRQDAAVMINKAIAAAQKTLPELREIVEAPDSNEVADYAVDSVNALLKAKILNGSNDGALMPGANCTRAQAAVMLNNVLTVFAAEGGAENE